MASVEKRPDVYVYQGFDGKSCPSAVPGAPRAFIKAFSKKQEPLKSTVSLYDIFSTMATGGGMGKSAYEIWLSAGNEGTVEDFLDSLVGPAGKDGASAYQIWLELGNSGTEQDFINSLVGEDGKSNYEIWLEAGNTGTPEEFLIAMQGADGKSAYELWLDAGNSGTLSDFFAYLANIGSYEQPFENAESVLVTHGLNRYPTVLILDSSNIACDAKVTYLGLNSLRVSIAPATSGRVICR